MNKRPRGLLGGKGITVNKRPRSLPGWYILGYMPPCIPTTLYMPPSYPVCRYTPPPWVHPASLCVYVRARMYTVRVAKCALLAEGWTGLGLLLPEASRPPFPVINVSYAHYPAPGPVSDSFTPFWPVLASQGPEPPFNSETGVPGPEASRPPFKPFLMPGRGLEASF